MWPDHPPFFFLDSPSDLWSIRYIRYFSIVDRPICLIYVSFGKERKRNDKASALVQPEQSRWGKKGLVEGELPWEIHPFHLRNLIPQLATDRTVDFPGLWGRCKHPRRVGYIKTIYSRIYQPSEPRVTRFITRALKHNPKTLPQYSSVNSLS